MEGGGSFIKISDNDDVVVVVVVVVVLFGVDVFHHFGFFCLRGNFEKAEGTSRQATGAVRRNSTAKT